MQIVHTHCAGLDVHKKSVVACVRLAQADGTISRHIRTFGTTTSDLLNLAAWLLSLDVTHVAMESTGEFWKPLYNLLESSFTLLLVNAAHIKHVPGRKTDVNDAEWIADLLAHGLMRPSFVPPPPQRALRDLTRQRTHLISERGSEVNRMQKVLEWANIKLASVVTDISGVSARAMLEAVVAGQTDVTVLAELAKGRLRSKRVELEQALRGTLQPHHAFMITQHLALIDTLDEQIAAFDERIHEAIEATRPPSGAAGERQGEQQPAAQEQPSAAPDGTWAAQAILDAIPGIGERTAEMILAELGTDMSRFPSKGHVSSWAGLSPGQHESAGKRKASRIRDGNKYLRATLVQAARAAVRKRGTFLSAYFGRLSARRGKRKVSASRGVISTMKYMLASCACGVSCGPDDTNTPAHSRRRVKTRSGARGDLGGPAGGRGRGKRVLLTRRSALVGWPIRAAAPHATGWTAAQRVCDAAGRAMHLRGRTLGRGRSELRYARCAPLNQAAQSAEWTIVNFPEPFYTVPVTLLMPAYGPAGALPIATTSQELHDER